MNMKDHILAALREQFRSWEELLASLSEEQITASHFDFDWSIKDVMAHVWAWQQVSMARMEAGLHNLVSELPKWIVESVENWEEDPDPVNALTFAGNHQKSWTEIYQNWKSGFLQLLDVAGKISEPSQSTPWK